jgi:hypothetical protein
MPLDKLELITKSIRRRFSRIASGEPGRGGYSHFVDLRKKNLNLPVHLYVGGVYSEIHKLVFIEVSKLSLRRIRKIVRKICGKRTPVKIYRFDWAIDIPNCSAWELSQHCRVANVQNSKFYHSRTGDSFYPHCSKSRTILIYDKFIGSASKRRSHSDDPSTKMTITRFEVQLRGAGVPIRSFDEIERYGELDLIKGVEIQRFRRQRPVLTSLQKFAAIGIQAVVEKIGLQNAAKMVPSANWAYLRKKFFEPASDDDLFDIRSLIQDDVRLWLTGSRRPPRVGSAK